MASRRTGASANSLFPATPPQSIAAPRPHKMLCKYWHSDVPCLLLFVTHEVTALSSKPRQKCWCDNVSVAAAACRENVSPASQFFDSWSGPRVPASVRSAVSCRNPVLICSTEAKLAPFICQSGFNLTPPGPVAGIKQSNRTREHVWNLSLLLSKRQWQGYVDPPQTPHWFCRQRSGYPGVFQWRDEWNALTNKNIL